jgi:hypothetical protein
MDCPRLLLGLRYDIDEVVPEANEGIKGAWMCENRSAASVAAQIYWCDRRCNSQFDKQDEATNCANVCLNKSDAVVAGNLNVQGSCGTYCKALCKRGNASCPQWCEAGCSEGAHFAHD